MDPPRRSYGRVSNDVLAYISHSTQERLLQLEGALAIYGPVYGPIYGPVYGPVYGSVRLILIGGGRDGLRGESVTTGVEP